MHTKNPIAEDFCTLFDSSFMIMGIALYRSLMRHCPYARLWVLAMDKLAADQLRQLNLPQLEVITLEQIEDSNLKSVKPTRSRGEYCWTLTPHLPHWLMKNGYVTSRVTYLDADLYFFSSPQKILDELDQSKKSVLITEHAYDPKYDQSATSGRFCVQFMTFLNTPGGLKVLEWWKARCIEWCYARAEDGKFGDQKYLDIWPELFGEDVHILQNAALTLAPWNVDYSEKINQTNNKLPVIYHFHSLRFISKKIVRLFLGYKIQRDLVAKYYSPYISELTLVYQLLKESNLHHAANLPLAKEKRLAPLKHVVRTLRGTHCLMAVRF